MMLLLFSFLVLSKKWWGDGGGLVGYGNHCFRLVPALTAKRRPWVQYCLLDRDTAGQEC